MWHVCNNSTNLQQHVRDPTHCDLSVNCLGWSSIRCLNGACIRLYFLQISPTTRSTTCRPWLHYSRRICCNMWSRIIKSKFYKGSSLRSETYPPSKFIFNELLVFKKNDLRFCKEGPLSINLINTISERRSKTI